MQCSYARTNRSFGRQKEAETRFQDVRRRVMDIYRSWELSRNNEVSFTNFIHPVSDHTVQRMI